MINFVQMLVDEASRLDQGEVMATRRTKDKNVVLDSEMSSWMLASLQKSQITKISGGNASIVGGTLSQSHLKTPGGTISPAVLDFVKSVANNVEVGGIGSPQKMMPFQDFYQMFQKYSDSKIHINAALPILSKEGTPQGDVDSNKAQTPVDDVKRKSGTPLISEKIRLSAGVKVGEPSTAANDHQMEAVNIVKQLTDMDPNFEAYLRVSGKDDTQLLRTKISSSNLIKPRRIRKVAPLGKLTAIECVVAHYLIQVRRRCI